MGVREGEVQLQDGISNEELEGKAVDERTSTSIKSKVQAINKTGAHQFAPPEADTLEDSLLRTLGRVTGADGDGPLWFKLHHGLRSSP